MKKIFLSAVFIACTFTLLAQYPTSLPNHIVTGVSTVRFKYENCFLNNTCYSNQGKVKAEIPPWIIPGGWRSYFIVNGNETNIWSTPESLVDNSEIDFKNESVGPYLASLPYLNENWRRNYNSIYSAHYINHPVQGGVSIGFQHSENKNYVSGSNCNSGTHYQNTMNPAAQINCSDHWTWSGGDPYEDGWGAYHAMVTAAWTPNNQQTNWGQQYFGNQLGPIAWPSNGYVKSNDVIASSGLKHPSSIIEGDYIYIFFSDGGLFAGSLPQAEGREEGIKVIRVHKNNALDPTQYRVYYKDPAGNVSWDPSLPPGFTKETMLQYAKVQGPKSTDVLKDATSDQSQEIRFSVAKVSGTNYFIGVEEYIDYNDFCSSGGNKFKVAIRFSYDLVNWSDRVLQIGASNCWDQHNMRYPILLNSNGWTNTEINLNDFYILGSHTITNQVNKVRLFYYVPPPPPPPPPDPCPPYIICHEEVEERSAKPRELSAAVIAYPNPTSSLTRLRFSVPKRDRVAMVLMDINGRVVRRITDKMYEAGAYFTDIDLSSKSSGMYLLQVIIGDERKHLKIIKQ